MEAEAKTESVKRAAHDYLRFRIGAPNPPHVLAATFPRELVHGLTNCDYLR